MTITLHWWLLPLCLFAGGILIAVVDDIRDGGGLGSGWGGALICLFCWLAAIGILIGHFL